MAYMNGLGGKAEFEGNHTSSDTAVFNGWMHDDRKCRIISLKVDCKKFQFASSQYTIF